MAEEVRHITINGKYRVVLERAASTKGTIGVKIEANGDDIAWVEKEAERLFGEAVAFAETMTYPVEVKEGK